ncbi:MAG: 5-(carboxyamino)imidazole ribonucleotide synthase [Thermomicrobiales bacterium]|nr:5-(carboxyamino)imidazole ribonucleotide synthase [Thermomicrobiales bacterium]
MATGRRVGVVGAGQLARMMAQAAIPLDIHLVLLAADANDGAAQVVRDVIVGSPDDPAKVRELAEATDVITFDHELVDPDFLATLEAEGFVVYPSAATMALAQNKRRQRAELAAIGLPIPAFADVESVQDVLDFADQHSWPVVLKASRGGYDGRGVWMLADAAASEVAVAEAHTAGLTLLVEECVVLDLELAVLTARRPNGDIAIWEPIETVQRNGMCNELVVPVQTESRIAAEAVTIARRIVEHIQPVGVMAIEFFVSNGKVLINELAPRPHNSGHWTIEGAQTSQFEQHLRAVLDLPLGDVSRTSPVVATENIIGPADNSNPVDRLPHALLIHGTHVHFYGKGARAGRKLGHVTVLGDDRDETRQRASLAIQQLTGEALP